MACIPPGACLSRHATLARRRDRVRKVWWDVRMRWQRSSRCLDRDCVEVALMDDATVAVRDSKKVDQPYLRFSRQDWTSFLDELIAQTSYTAPTNRA